MLSNLILLRKLLNGNEYNHVGSVNYVLVDYNANGKQTHLSSPIIFIIPDTIWHYDGERRLTSRFPTLPLQEPGWYTTNVLVDYHANG